MRRLTDDAGAATIVVALMLVTVLGMAAFAIDLGAMLVQRRALQNGADASAIAIAKSCAEREVDPSRSACVDGEPSAPTLAATYLGGNGSTAAVPQTQIEVSHAGKVGSATVVGTTSSQPIFARFLQFTDAFGVAASATARWGPLTAIDAAFPLAVCKGALPAVGQSTTLVVDPLSAADPNICDGAPDALPFGWTSPDDFVACTTKITVLPPTYLDIDDPAAVPTSAGCVTALDSLLASIPGPVSDRTRVIPVYDASRGTPTSRPSYSLVALEVTGLRFGTLEAHLASEACATGLLCIRGKVAAYMPPTDGPIVDPALASLPAIDDTTVLDVRLVD